MIHEWLGFIFFLVSRIEQNAIVKVDTPIFNIFGITGLSYNWELNH